MQNDPIHALGTLWHQASLKIGRTEARFLLEKVSGCHHADLVAHPERKISPPQTAQFEALVARRAAGEPLAYLLGESAFYGRDFIVTPDVLIPREDTEVLVDQASAWIQKQHKRKIRILELGTGSGIVAVTLALFFPCAAITATDVSGAALDVAQQNALRHRALIRFLCGDWFEPVKGENFDLVVSNPPYVAYADPHLEQNGLPFEPQIALTDGVEDAGGMACIRLIIENAYECLTPDGVLMLEHGYDQAEAVRAHLARSGYGNIASWRDKAGIERVSNASRTDQHSFSGI